MGILSGSIPDMYLNMENEDVNIRNKISIHTYKFSEVPIHAISQSSPVAFIETTNGEYVISIVNFKLHLKLITTVYKKEVCSLNYFKWEIDKSIYESNYQVKRSCILLPMLTLDDNYDSCSFIYTAITNDYMEIDKKSTFVKHILCINDIE